jgi:alkylhydroperoxidase/carboxymuconolactone decarboxylase family protein YurZ
VARHLGDLLHETRQTKARIKEGNCPRHIESWGAGSEVARQDRALSGASRRPLSILPSECRSNCSQCVAYHAEAAFSRGATGDEVLEAALVAMLMEGEPVQPHWALVMQTVRRIRQA